MNGLLDAKDTRVMLGALQKLDIIIDLRNFATMVVNGAGCIPCKKMDLFLANAGTAFRPLTAALAVSGGEYRLMGKPRMHQRPIRDLVEPLRAIGARIDYLGREGYPPLQVRPGTIRVEGPIPVRGNVSSQYLSALLMALPLAGGGTVAIVGELISRTYVAITLNMMRKFGVEVRVNGWQSFDVPGFAYVAPEELHVEGDASSASYFLAAGGAVGRAGRVCARPVLRTARAGDRLAGEPLRGRSHRQFCRPPWFASPRLPYVPKVQAQITLPAACRPTV